VSLLLPAVAVSGVVNAAEQRERKITTGEIEKWLEAEPGTKQTDEGAEDADEEPLPAPRHHGFVVESGVGFVNHLGELKNIAPMAPWFQVRVGFEPFPFLMPFVEADASFASTAYASRPPPPRSFWHYGAGAGLRLTFAISQTFGVMAQGSFGLALISEQNVLSIYGFPDADEPALYAGGEVGFEWYPVNPHLTVGLRGGIRTFGSGLARELGGDPPLAALGSAQIRYAF
jgi:hypothetical protein